MTWSYVVLLDAAMREPELEGADFEALLRVHPRLLDARRGIIFDHYDAAEMSSDVARERFVLPRRK
jgi:hypothetical protein